MVQVYDHAPSNGCNFIAVVGTDWESGCTLVYFDYLCSKLSLFAFSCRWVSCKIAGGVFAGCFCNTTYRDLFGFPYRKYASALFPMKNSRFLPSKRRKAAVIVRCLLKQQTRVIAVVRTKSLGRHLV